MSRVYRVGGRQRKEFAATFAQARDQAFEHTLATCASLLIAEGASMLRLQRWMGHHSAAYTLETYGHLIDGELGNALELNALGIQTGMCSKAESRSSHEDDELPVPRPK